MPALLLAVLLSQASPARVLVAAPDFTAVGMEAQLVGFYSAHFAQELQRHGLRTITSKDIAAVIGLDRQKELLGCKDSTSSCLTELASALGADALMTGEIADLGPFRQVNLRIISARDGSSLAVRSVRGVGPDELLAELSRAAAQMAAQVNAAFGRAPPVEVAGAPGAGAARRWWWLPAGAGAAVAVAGGAFLFDSKSRYDALSSGTTPFSQTDLGPHVQAGETNRVIGLAGLAVGGAALAVGVGMYLFGADASVQVSAAAGPGGAGLALTGATP